jgi:predicted dehydrogenase
VRVFAGEPVPSNVLELDVGGWTSLSPAPAATLRTLGLPRLSRVFREAAETLAAFGDARSVLIEHWAAPHHGSLAARLIGAIDLAHSLVGETETIDAVHVPSGVGGLAARGSDRSLLGHHGDLNATLRTADGRSALVAVSNAAARWNWCVTLLGEKGRLRFYDDGFEWLGPEGEKRDEHRDPARTRGSAAPDHAAAVMSDSLCRMLDDSLPDPGPLNVSSVLPAAHAAFLSARTSHPENPGTIRRMILA